MPRLEQDEPASRPNEYVLEARFMPQERIGAAQPIDVSRRLRHVSYGRRASSAMVSNRFTASSPIARPCDSRPISAGSSLTPGM